MLRYLLDEDISYWVADGLRTRSIDALSVHDVGRSAMSDEEQLGFATQQGRVLVTYNRADFQCLDAAWRMAGRRHAGILWCSERTIPRRAFGALIDALEVAVSRFESLDGLCVPLTSR